MFIARHVLPASMATLEDVVKRAQGRAAARYAGLVREVAEHIDRKDPVSPGDWAVIALPTGLVARLLEATR